MFNKVLVFKGVLVDSSVRERVFSKVVVCVRFVVLVGVIVLDKLTVDVLKELTVKVFDNSEEGDDDRKERLNVGVKKLMFVML